MYHVEILLKQSRTGFHCGNQRIDDYFQKQVSQDVKRRYAICYLLMDDKDNIAGFYTLSSCHILLSDVPSEFKKKLPCYPTVPAARIGWLARNQKFHGGGVGKLLVIDALKRVAQSGVGMYAILVDAIDDKAADFYLNLGFEPLIEKTDTLFLPIETAQQLFP